MTLPILPPAPSVLPPFVGPSSTERALRAPYQSTMEDFASHFGTSAHRGRILRGLLAFRQELRKHPINAEYQWLAGSYVENLPREPNDVDVVTFYRLTAAEVTAIRTNPAVQAEIAALFDPKVNKPKYLCDAYTVNIASPPLNLIEDTHYWYGLFSHQRASYAWKGIVAVKVADATDDARAEALLASRGF